MHSSLQKITAVSLCFAGALFAGEEATDAQCTACPQQQADVQCKENCEPQAKQENANENQNSVANSANAARSQQGDVAKLSETFGHLIGRNLDNPGIKFDLESIVKGMRDAAAGSKAPMTEQEYEEAIAGIQEGAFNELANRNLKEANTFMEGNSREKEIVEVEPGRLQYRVIANGQGAEVTSGSTPTIRYTGTYIDGTLFGSSEEAGGPVTLPLDQTIPGFQKGLVGMKEGERRRIYIHPDLGYGTAGHLPPNSLLVFDVEIVASNANAADVASKNDEAKEANVAEGNKASKEAAL